MKAVYMQADGTVPYTPTNIVNPGDVVVIGGIVGIAKRYIAALTLGALAIEGLYLVSKAAVAMTFGQALYWDATAGVVTTDPAGGANAYFGRALAAALTTDATVGVLLGENRLPQQAVIPALVDDSGGAVSTTLAAIPGTLTQASVANAVASLAAQINVLTAAMKASGIVATA